MPVSLSVATRGARVPSLPRHAWGSALEAAGILSPGIIFHTGGSPYALQGARWLSLAGPLPGGPDQRTRTSAKSPAMTRLATSRHSPARLLRASKHAHLSRTCSKRPARPGHLIPPTKTSQGAPDDRPPNRHPLGSDRKLQVRQPPLWASHLGALAILNRCHQVFSFDVATYAP